MLPNNGQLQYNISVSIYFTGVYFNSSSRDSTFRSSTSPAVGALNAINFNSSIVGNGGDQELRRWVPSEIANGSEETTQFSGSSKVGTELSLVVFGFLPSPNSDYWSDDALDLFIRPGSLEVMA